MGWDPCRTFAMFSGRYASVAQRPLSKVEDGIVNIESTMRDTICIFNFMQIISIIGWNSNEYHKPRVNIRLCIIFLNFHDFSKFHKNRTLNEMTIHLSLHATFCKGVSMINYHTDIAWLTHRWIQFSKNVLRHILCDDTIDCPFSPAGILTKWPI